VRPDEDGVRAKDCCSRSIVGRTPVRLSAVASKRKKPPSARRSKAPTSPRQRAPSAPRHTIPVEDEWLESDKPPKPGMTIPVEPGWIIPEIPVPPKPPPLPRVEVIEGHPPEPKRVSKRPSKRHSKKP
jgi:hypothetical protein